MRLQNEFLAIPYSVPYRPAAAHSQAVDLRLADGGGGRPGGRGDLHRQVRPGEGAVLLGPLGEEGREQLVLGAGRRRRGPGRTGDAIQIPRIGQEVIVEFLEGDPDRPIITGRVYNAEQMPPYALPANMTQSGIKTRSSQGWRDGRLQRDPVRGQEGQRGGLPPRPEGQEGDRGERQQRRHRAQREHQRGE